MNTTGTITMSMRELDRFGVIQAVAERPLKPGRAAERLDMSVRKVERLVWRYRAVGVAGLVSASATREQSSIDWRCDTACAGVTRKFILTCLRAAASRS